MLTKFHEPVGRIYFVVFEKFTSSYLTYLESHENNRAINNTHDTFKKFSGLT